MKHITLLCALCITLFSFSQSTNFKITGTLSSDQEKTPLESATVHLEAVKDSTLITYTITDKAGKFALEGKAFHKEVNLFISYVGYQTYKKTMTLDKPNIDLGDIKLAIDANALDEVLIKTAPPVTVKKDTLEFNVKSFKTRKDANVEDLLKKLPGVEVDEDGKITVNGKEVNKILVNGKPFFGNDPTITTKNLSKELIEKVQITDTKSKSEAFSGEEGSKTNKTINLTIKEENNKGVFGRLSGGAGTDERYEFAGMLNRFDNDQRISVLAGGNNINSAGFSFGEIEKMLGSINSVSFESGGSFSINGRSFGGGQGLTKSQNYGVNYADDLGKLDISADYFYAGSDSENKTTTSRENILPDSRFFTESSSSSYNDNNNHRANLGFDIEIDSTFLINVNPSFNYTKNTSQFSRDEETRDEAGDTTNQSTSSSFVETLGKNFSNDLDITKRFGDKGAFVKFNMSNDFNSNESDDFLSSTTDIFGTVPESIVRDQFSDSDRKSRGFDASATYRLPLIAKELFLDFKYSFRDDKNENVRSTYDFDAGSQQYDDFNTDLSTDFENINRTSTPSLRLKYNKDKLSLSFTSGYVFRTLENNDFLRPSLSLKRNFEAVEIRSNLRYRFGPGSSISFGYNLDNSPPSLTQLQPFQDVSNPLNIVTGNPDLEPTNNHRVYFNYNSFDFQKGQGFFTYLNANFRNNQVVTNTTVDDNFVRNTTYANVDGGYNISGSINYNKRIKLDTIRTVRLRFGLSSSINKNINFNNGEKYASVNTSLNPRVGVRFNWNKLFEISPNYRINFNMTKFDLDTFEDQDFLSHTFGIRTATFVPKKLEWRNNINFNYNPNVAPGFQKSAWFWNSTLAYSIMKDKGTITLKAYDLLNQNTNARRIATANYIQDSQSTVLQRYFMLSFSWKFNSLGPKGRVRGGNFMIMH